MSDEELRQADIATLTKILEASPAGGMSIDDIQIAVGRIGESWTYRTINNLLCDLGNRIKHEKVRLKSGKITKYQLRSPQP